MKVKNGGRNKLNNPETFGEEDPFYSPQRKLAVWAVLGHLGPNPGQTGLQTEVPVEIGSEPATFCDKNPHVRFEPGLNLGLTRADRS
jgi:hypothetical protein